MIEGMVLAFPLAGLLRIFSSPASRAGELAGLDAPPGPLQQLPEQVGDVFRAVYNKVRLGDYLGGAFVALHAYA